MLGCHACIHSDALLCMCESSASSIAYLPQLIMNHAIEQAIGQAVGQAIGQTIKLATGLAT